MNKIVLISLLFLAGCATTPDPSINPVSITTTVRPVEILHPPLPDAVVWEDFDWIVLTPDIIREMLRKYDAGELSEKDVVLFAMTPKGYERLAVNIAEVKRVLKDQKSVIMYYRSTVPKDIFLKDETK